jgi:hypothetical protein
MKSLLLIVLFSLICSEAHAFWWLLRAGASGGRTASAVGRVGGTGAAATATEFAAAANSLTRFCVRPVGARACDFRSAASAREAVVDAVGSSYGVRSTGRPSVFEIIDHANTIVSLLQADSSQSNPEVQSMPQHTAQYGPAEHEYAIVNFVPLIQGRILMLHINQVPTEIWADGLIEVWGDTGSSNIMEAGRRTRSPGGHNTLNIRPLRAEATTLFYISHGNPQNSQPSIFPLNSNVSCPQIPIGNGMARCQ